MLTTTQNLADSLDSALERANMAPHPMAEVEPFHFSSEYRDVALRHVWKQNCVRVAQGQERGIPRFI